MRLATLAAAVLAALALAACGDHTPQPRTAAQPAAPATAPAPATSSAGATAGKEDRKEGANPVQQQVDPKEKEQRRDFESRGDKAGPTSPETQPKN